MRATAPTNHAPPAPLYPMPERRGMLVKNVTETTLDIRMLTRKLTFEPGEELLVTATEVRDTTLREHLQIRTIAIVRPSTDEEAADLAERLAAA